MTASNRAAIMLVVELINAAKSGVTYSQRYGAECPACGNQLSTTKTMPWDGCFRTRYHKCCNPDCALSMLGQSIKSIQEL